MIAAILVANPTEWIGVEVAKADLPSILVMGATPLSKFSRDKLAEHSESADWVRSLAAGAETIGGPVLAIARSADGPLTLFDGMHRMAAWVAHVNAGRDYPINVSVVVTANVAPQFELPT